MGVVKFFVGLICLGLVINVRCGYITASGGGIVAKGGNLVLQYHMEKPFHTCIWFKVDPNGEKSYCMFDEASHNITRAHPKGFCDNIQYTGESKEVCEVTLLAVTQSMGGKWEARDFLEHSASSIDVVVADPIESVSIKVSPYSVGTEGVIICVVKGGNLAPVVIRKYEPKLGNRSQFEESSHSEQKVLDDGQHEFRWETVINPQIEDHGRKVECVASQYDLDDERLFPPSSSEQIALNVTYPPQPQGNQTIHVSMGEDVIVSFAIKSNPMAEVRWYINKEKLSDDEYIEDLQRNMNEAEYNETTMVLKPGQDYSKYYAKDLESTDVENEFNATLVIKNITEADIDASYYFMEAENKNGIRSYFFSIAGSEGTDIPDENESIGSMVFVGIGIGAAVAAVLIVSGFCIFFRKRAMVNPRKD